MPQAQGEEGSLYFLDDSLTEVINVMRSFESPALADESSIKSLEQALGYWAEGYSWATGRTTTNHATLAPDTVQAMLWRHIKTITEIRLVLRQIISPGPAQGSGIEDVRTRLRTLARETLDVLHSNDDNITQVRTGLPISSLAAFWTIYRACDALLRAILEYPRDHVELFGMLYFEMSRLTDLYMCYAFELKIGNDVGPLFRPTVEHVGPSSS